MGYAAAVRERALGYSPGEPIFTREMADDMAKELALPVSEARRLVALNVKRLVDAGVLARFCNGVVYRPEQSAFGTVPLDPADLASRLYLEAGGQTIGYVTGATFLNEVGACTWLPREVEIATNVSVRDAKAARLGVRLLKPKTRVTAENAAYLQMLDAVVNLRRLAVDGDDPEDALWLRIREGLELGKLLGLASRHYSAGVVRTLAKMAERDAA